MLLVSGLVLSACAGGDLKKEFSQRTTVTVAPAAGAKGQVPQGPITEPSVAAAKLRVVDPCGLLGEDVLSPLGRASGEPSSFSVEECSSEVTDAGGKTVNVRVRLGDAVIGGTDKATGSIEGLPLVETSHDEGTCFVSAMTSEDPDLAITAQIRYEGGEPCSTGRQVLGKIVQRIKSGAPKLEVAKGSLVPLDPCTTLDAKLAERLSGATKTSPVGLHNCNWFGKSTIGVDLRFGHPPEEEKGSRQVDLGGGVKGWLRARSESKAVCTATWTHRKISDSKAEFVTAEYANYSEGGEKAADACRKIESLAKTVVAKLPKP